MKGFIHLDFAAKSVPEALFQNARRHTVAAAVHRLAEFSEESRDQPRSLDALSLLMNRCVRPFTPYRRLCDHDCGVARGTFVCFSHRRPW
jgi:hypothetical protein